MVSRWCRTVRWSFAVLGAGAFAACSEDPLVPPELPDLEPAFLTTHTRLTTPGAIRLVVTSSVPLRNVEIHTGETRVAETLGSEMMEVAFDIEVPAAPNGTRLYHAMGSDVHGRSFSLGPLSLDVDIRWDLIRPITGINAAGAFAVPDGAGGVLIAGNTFPDPRTTLTDIFVARFDGGGNQLWLRTFGGPDRETAASLSADADGNAYTSGSATAAFGEGAQLLLVFSPGGELIETRRVEFDQTRPIEGVWVPDGSGGFYALGSVGEWVGDPERSRYDIVVTRYGPGGTPLWTRELGSTPGRWNDDIYAALAVGGDGAAYVTGYTDGSMDGTPNVGGRDVFLVKYDGDGNKLWTRQYGTTHHDFPSSLVSDHAGGVYVVGSTDHPELRYGDHVNALILRYGSDGTLRWAREFDNSAIEYASTAVADENGIWIAGGTSPGGLAWQFGEGTQRSSRDAYLARISRDGELESVRLLGGPLDDSGGSLVAGTNGTLFMVLSAAGLPNVKEQALVLARHREPAP